MNTDKLSLEWLACEYKILRFSPELGLPSSLLSEPEFTISKSVNEVSVLLPNSAMIDISAECQSEVLVGFRVSGVLDHSLIGILAEISKVLADATIPIFAISTYDTDYIYINRNLRDEAYLALVKAGYRFA